MKLSYEPTTDSLYIHLQDQPAIDSREIVDGVVLDFDAAGALVGIDLQHAGKIVDISSLIAINIPYGLE
ncbi:DUF2283 domain-containing protein [Methylomonas sp. LWB]|uniref:DUF2283 domain-containing protein n=1 Tax=unclassified Methylomonas TaxID=2608980 RepID=UPI0008D93A44|nr:DUF2283 domain-containing protein [Methylomonas sp. LWB]OHX34039.1 hypothetical protein BJL95_05970 [Methylomonas sp. LWB]